MRTSMRISLRLLALLACAICSQASLERENNEGTNMANVSYQWINYFIKTQQKVEVNCEIR